MTDATIEQQGEPKRRREHLEVPQAADSGSSSSRESSTDTEMGLVDVRTYLSENSEAESRCPGGRVTLDLRERHFSKADCRNQCRKLVENSKPLLLIGLPNDSVGTGQPSTCRGDKEQARAVLHLAFICELCEVQVHGSRHFLHTHSRSADSWEQSAVVDFMNRFPDTFQTVTDWSLFGPNVPDSMDTLTRWLTSSVCIAQALSSSTHSSMPWCAKRLRAQFAALIVRPECHWNDGPDATSSVFGNSCG